jgi:predicted HTH domain antitoxin
MIVPVEIPDRLAKQFHFDQSDRSREMLESFVLQRFAEGELTIVQAGEALGLSFHQTEQFLKDHGAPPNINADEHRQDLANLDRMTLG